MVAGFGIGITAELSAELFAALFAVLAVTAVFVLVAVVFRNCGNKYVDATAISKTTTTPPSITSFRFRANQDGVSSGGRVGSV